MKVFSVSESNLVKIWKSAKNIAPNNGIIDTNCQNSPPGLIIIIIPVKPINIAIQRCMPTFSFRIRTEKIVINKGATNPIAVASANGDLQAFASVLEIT